MIKDFEKALNLISEQIKIYREADTMDGETMNKALQQISATLFYLEKERAKYHEQWQSIVYKLVKNEQVAVNRAENEANVLVPEMYLLRRTMDAAYSCCDAIRTNISWLKMEINQNK